MGSVSRWNRQLNQMQTRSQRSSKRRWKKSPRPLISLPVTPWVKVETGWRLSTVARRDAKSQQFSPVLVSLCCAYILGALSVVQAGDPVEAPIQFSVQEKAYIEKAGVICMCVDPDWKPFERINERGEHEGIAADLIQLVAQRVGLKITLYPVKTWDESLTASKAGRCQIMSFLNKTPEREKWLSFTDPIFFDPNIIITREEHAYIGDIRGLRNETIALPRGTMVEESIRNDYPNLKIIPTDSEPESVALVSERKADMTIRSLIVAAYAIKKEGLFNGVGALLINMENFPGIRGNQH